MIFLHCVQYLVGEIGHIPGMVKGRNGIGVSFTPVFPEDGLQF